MKVQSQFITIKMWNKGNNYFLYEYGIATPSWTCTSVAGRQTVKKAKKTHRKSYKSKLFQRNS